MNRTIRLFSLTLAVVLMLGSALAFAACNPQDNTKDNVKYYDNETDKLVFSTLEVDKVFNPFFATSGTDSNVVGMTQISMLSNDENGKAVYGDDEATVTQDLQIITNDQPKDDGQQTTYYFVLKNNVRFSNGSYLTIADVLFNLYVYLDPAYTGSSTIYSTNIIGLQEYRTQQESEKDQDSFDLEYKTKARARIDNLIEAASDVIDVHGTGLTEDEMVEYLTEEWASQSDYQNVVKDFQKAAELFKEELGDDYSNSVDSYTDQVFTDKNGEIYKNLLTSDVEMFLLNESVISWNKNDAKLEYNIDDAIIEAWKSEVEEAAKSGSAAEAEAKEEVKQEAIDLVYQMKMPDSIEQILTYWNTANTLFDYLVGEEMENDNTSMKYQNISGIKFANYDGSVTVNGVTYEQPEYETYTDDDGQTGERVKEGYHEVLSITIENVDPKAIWNFSFSVAPMYYYSDQEFDYANNKFGVVYKSQTWLNEVVKANIGVPVGAGPYAASKAAGGIKASDIESGDFYDKGVIYFERNPYYLFDVTVKYVRFQVVSSNGMLESLQTGQVDYAEPNAKPETTTELDKSYDDGLAYTKVPTLGYGYIGINAGKIPNVYVRRAIMYSIDTSLTVSYYKTLAQPIYRSMSRESWAYPEDAVAYYPYIGGTIPKDVETLANNGEIDYDYYAFVLQKGKKGGEKFTEDEQIEFIQYLMDKAGYVESGGIYADKSGKNKCEFTFTIAGQETDHPAYNAMVKAGQLLDKAGFSITVKTDKNALSKLSTGALTVWAAAWGSTIDPDMYQVYHKDSKATSVTNWGYKQILTSTSGYVDEKAWIEELSELIDEAREISYPDDIEKEHKARAVIYSQALDIVMEMAIELPTYQRQDLFAYNYLKIDTSTFYQNPVALKGLTSEIHNISLVTYLEQ